MSPAIWGFMGVLVGGAVTLLATWLQQSHASNREREAAEREAAERRRVFQSETLLELQEAVAALIRFHGRANYLDEVEYHKSGTWGRSQLPEDVNLGIHNSSVRMLLLSERVDCNHVREHIRAFHRELVQLNLSRDRDEARDLMLRAGEESEALQLEVGEAFRAL